MPVRAEELKGHLDALILAVLVDGPLHGYAIIEELKRRSGGALALPEGTVYPALHRLERSGLLESSSSDGPTAQLGSPEALAREFADELGTSRARRGAFAGFAALALDGAMLATFLVEQFGPVTHQTAVVDVAGGILLVAAQVAFAAGVLAVLRAIRRRSDHSLPRAEAVVLVRRSAVALGAGLVTMTALAVAALALSYVGHTGARSHALVIAAVGGAALLAALPYVVSAARLLPSKPGEAGDIFEDIGWLAPPVLRGHPWLVALLVGGGLALVTAAAGVVQSDPYDGAARGLAEAIACLAGFSLLGQGRRPLAGPTTWGFAEWLNSVRVSEECVMYGGHPFFRRGRSR